MPGELPEEAVGQGSKQENATGQGSAASGTPANEPSERREPQPPHRPPVADESQKAKSENDQ